MFADFRRTSVSLLLVATLAATAVPARAAGAGRPFEIPLSKGRTAEVEGGYATIYGPNHHRQEFRHIVLPYRESTKKPSTKLLALALAKPVPRRPYAPGRIIVVFRDGMGVRSGATTVTPETLVATRRAGNAAQRSAVYPALTADPRVNATFAELGVAKLDRIAAHLAAVTPSARTTIAGNAQLSLGNAYRVRVTASSVYGAVKRLQKLPGVAFVEPDWTVSPMHVPAQHLSDTTIRDATSRARTFSARRSLAATSTTSLPTNFALTTSAQSLLNAPSTDAAAAYDLIGKTFHQLPGEGVRITNVSLGDVTDPAGAAACGSPGPTVILSGGQHYLDFPSMPLIPVYTADADGNLSGSLNECGQDYSLGEVGLDFSMMAPLPHDRQRPSATGSGYYDLLGLAPGAQYRLVVPANGFPATTEIVSAFLAAATQTPRPDVVTMSLGFGEDVFGFPSRYFEEDPIVASAVSYVTHQLGEVVCISANDGTRLFTNAAVDPVGGSVATQIGSPDALTNLDDLAFSTAPSTVLDTDAIDVGGTTLDDIFSAPPIDPKNYPLHTQHAFPEVRWNGFEEFSSGFGSRANVSAPSDNVIALSFGFDANDNFAVVPSNNGGTSASAPEVAAAAAVAIQVARLTGHPFRTPRDVRKFLISTANAVPNVPQADRTIDVGPQIDLDRAVETLLTTAGKSVTPAVPRVAVEQRRPYYEDTSDHGAYWDPSLDGIFFSDTDPTAINLKGPTNVDLSGTEGRNEYAWITIAPDWEGLPPNATFELTLTNNAKKVLATTRWARLQPADILAAAGMPLVGGDGRTVNLTYRAQAGNKTLHIDVPLTFGSAPLLHDGAPAPIVPAVATGATVPVAYDITNLHVGFANVATPPTLVVSEPARMSPAAARLSGIADTTWHVRYSVALQGSRGVVNVPISALDGAGVYGTSVRYGFENSFDKNTPKYTDFAFFRVPANGRVVADAPLLSGDGTTYGHYLEIPNAGTFSVSWDVSNVRNASGAMLEISAPGNAGYDLYRLFNNPGGDVRDHNDIDTGSRKYITLPGVKGTKKFFGQDALISSTQATVRVIPTNGSTPVAGASLESSIYMYGILAADDGYIVNYAVGHAASDAALTSDQLLDFDNPDNPTILTSLETFDQVARAATNTIAVGTGQTYYVLLADNIFPGSTIPVIADIETKFPPTYDTTIAQLTPPGSLGQTIAGSAAKHYGQFAPNQVDDVAFGLVYTNKIVFLPGNSLTAVDLKTNTVIADVDVTSIANDKKMGAPTASTAVYDPAARTGYFGVGDYDFCDPNERPFHITSLNIDTGKLETRDLPFIGLSYQIALDPATHVMAIPTACGQIAFYNTATHATTVVDTPGKTPVESIAVDLKSHQFVAGADLPPNLFVDNNVESPVYLYDESGNRLRTFKDFGFFQLGALPSNHIVLNDATRTGYAPSDFGHEIAPFNY